MTRLTVTLQLYGCNITSIKVVMLLQDLDKGNDRCWANGWLHGQGLAIEGRLKAHPGRYDYWSQRNSNHHSQWYRIINANIVLKHQLKLWQVLASVPVQDSALLEPLTSLGCAGDVIFVIVIVILACSRHVIFKPHFKWQYQCPQSCVLTMWYSGTNDNLEVANWAEVGKHQCCTLTWRLWLQAL